MGLAAEDLGDVSRLATLALTTPKSNRNDIYVAVARLFKTQAEQLSDRERVLMRDILKRLTLDVEMAIRISLAEKLADDPEAPLDLVLLLADDAIEVARPIILRSQKLTDREILGFLKDADEARQMACAERPHIGEPVTNILSASNAETVLIALVRNVTAQIAAATFETLVEKSRLIAALQEPLARREDLPAPLAARMSEWASDALKAYITRKRNVDRSAISGAVDQATRTVAAPTRPDASESGRKLVDKLATAGQLKPGFLVRVLQQGQTDLFEIAFAKLLEMEPTAFRDVFYRRGPRPVALACRAVGIDRCVFPTIYSGSRKARSINPALSADEQIEVYAVFGSLTRKEATEILKHFN